MKNVVQKEKAHRRNSNANNLEVQYIFMFRTLQSQTINTNINALTTFHVFFFLCIPVRELVWCLYTFTTRQNGRCLLQTISRETKMNNEHATKNLQIPATKMAKEAIRFRNVKQNTTLTDYLLRFSASFTDCFGCSYVLLFFSSRFTHSFCIGWFVQVWN